MVVGVFRASSETLVVGIFCVSYLLNNYFIAYEQHTWMYNLAPMVGELLVYLEQAVNLWLLVFLVSGARGPGETAISEGQRSK